MLQFLRKFTTSWVGAIVLGVVLVAMVVTLFYGKSAGGPAAATRAIATVGGEAVPETQFVKLFDNVVARERERNPRVLPADLVRAGAAESVLDQLVSIRAIDAFARQIGLSAPKRVVDGDIASVPAFQAAGKFDEAQFRRVLAEQRISEAEVREDFASTALRRQLLAPVALGAGVPAAQAQALADLLLETRRGSIAAVPAGLMPAPTPTDAQLRAFHRTQARAFTVPERRAFRFAVIEGAVLAAQQTVTDAEMQQYFQENIAEFGGAEQRILDGVVLPDEAAARRVAAAGPAGFAAAAAAAGFSAADQSLGTLTREALAAATAANVADAVFKAPAGTVVGPISSPLGFHVIRVRAVTAARADALAAARPRIVAAVRARKGEDALADAVAKAEDRMAEGESIADVAKSLGLQVLNAPPTTADGRVIDSPVQLADTVRPLIAKAFAAEPGEGGRAEKLADDRYALFEVTEIVPASVLPFDRARTAVLQLFQAQAREAAAKALADRIAAAVNAGQPLAALAAANRLPPPQALTVRRLELTQMANQGQQIPPPVVTLLSLPAGKARVISAGNGQGWFVVRTEAVARGNAAGVPQLTGAIRSSLSREAEAEMSEALVAAVRRQVGVQVNPQALATAKARLAGAGSQP